MTMKRIFVIYVVVLFSIAAFGQAPDKISYQAVIRNSSDQLVIDKQIGMQISILKTSPDGINVYKEIQKPTTNANGLVTIEIGTGTTTDSFASIDWSAGPYFIKTEIDPDGGTNYTIIGTSQLLSVPYALHAKTADSIMQEIVSKSYVDAFLNKIDELEVLSNGFVDARDQNNYKVVKIGDQIWMAENLKYLPKVDAVDNGSEDAAAGKYYYVYDYVPSGASETEQINNAATTLNYQTYGVMYNWNAAMNGSASSNNNPSGVQGVCPSGWHLPSNAEWIELSSFLGGESVAGGKLKELGTIHWNNPNNGFANLYGFNALPGGTRYDDGTFSSIGDNGEWWCSTKYDAVFTWFADLRYNETGLNKYYNLIHLGLSVRCIRD